MRKLMNKKLNKKGFTLMEMLIVVAIIAILVAIAIPTFTKSLNKAKVAADEANLRAYYAEAMATYLLDDTAPTPVSTASKKVTINGTDYDLYGSYTSTWTNEQLTISYTGPGNTTATIPNNTAAATNP